MLRSIVALAALLALPAQAALRTELLVDGLLSPVFATAPPGDSRLFIVERAGVVRILADGELLPTPFLDMQADVTTEGAFGMFGMAFAPDFAATGQFYVYAIDPSWDSTITRYTVGPDPHVADASSKQVVFRLAQTWRDHNGGTIAFHPLDGSLYFAPGDGGGGPNDPDETGQDPLNRLGKMLRMDRVGGIPTDNPFVGNAQVDEMIWALGLRNPFRFSFDRLTGELWIADVGQEGVEEILVEPGRFGGGRNYGWDVMEGTLCNPNDPASSPPCNDPVFSPPLYEYDHSQGDCSVTGGYAYRGAIPEIFGKYLFGDYCSGRMWTLERDPLVVTDLQLPIPGLVGFGEDGFGELVAISLGGSIHRILSTDPDADGDIAPDAADCAPADPSLWSVPGETRSLTVDGSTIHWQEPVLLGGSAGMSFELLVSTGADFTSPDCSVEASPSAVDAIVPAPGGVRFYLSRAVNACGTGSVGRPVSAC